MWATKHCIDTQTITKRSAGEQEDKGTAAGDSGKGQGEKGEGTGVWFRGDKGEG